jgi:helicase MOV-10
VSYRSLPSLHAMLMRFFSIIKLLKNFRSHEAILDFPNRTFYRGELQAAYTDKVLVCSLQDWKFLPGKKFPVMFHSICGSDEREASSPSYFNRPEASQVKNYVKWLLSTQGISKFHLIG